VRILFLSQRVPYPPNRGDKITTWRLVERMKRTHDVTCVAFAHDERDIEAAQQLTSMGVPTRWFPYDDRKAKLRSLPLLLGQTPLTLGVYGSRELQAAVDELMPSMDLAYAYSSSMGAFLEPHVKKPRVMHFGELDSDKWRQYSHTTRFPMSWVYRREARTLLAFESRVAHSFSANVLCTPIEEELFQERIPGAPTTVLRNGVDLEYYRPVGEGSRESDGRGGSEGEDGNEISVTRDPHSIVFTGVMNYFPNVDAVRFFVLDVLPHVHDKLPKARFTIVGAHPTAEVRKLAKKKGVEVTGFVSDTRDYLRRASVSVAPLRIARGIQNKVLEAMAMGLPVVGTKSATQGVEGQNGRDYWVADEPLRVASAVIDLLKSPREARELGLRGRKFVEQNYDWEVVFRPLDELLARCVAAEPIRI
jgi:sugar transferase (PEP-CTERM/EpsH1 system associated)